MDQSIPKGLKAWQRSVLFPSNLDMTVKTVANFHGPATLAKRKNENTEFQNSNRDNETKIHAVAG